MLVADVRPAVHCTMKHACKAHQPRWPDRAHPALVAAPRCSSYCSSKARLHLLLLLLLLFSYPLDEIIDHFKPFNPNGWPAHAEAKKHGGSHDDCHDRPPPCTGQCNTGKCNMDKSHPGCCTLGPWKYFDAEAQKATGTGKTAAAEYKTKEGEVYCWDGTESPKKDHGKTPKKTMESLRTPRR